MVASNANPGFGIIFGIGDGATAEVFTNILADILSVNGVGITHRTAEVTHMDSIGGWAEHIALGVKEGKPFTLGMNWVADDVDQTALQDLVISGAKGNYQFTFTDDAPTTLTFEAIIQDLDINHDRDSQAQSTLTVLPSGVHTFA